MFDELKIKISSEKADKEIDSLKAKLKALVARRYKIRFDVDTKNTDIDKKLNAIKKKTDQTNKDIAKNKKRTDKQSAVDSVKEIENANKKKLQSHTGLEKQKKRITNQFATARRSDELRRQAKLADSLNKSPAASARNDAIKRQDQRIAASGQRASAMLNATNRDLKRSINKLAQKMDGPDKKSRFMKNFDGAYEESKARSGIYSSTGQTDIDTANARIQRSIANNSDYFIAKNREAIEKRIQDERTARKLTRREARHEGRLDRAEKKRLRSADPWFMNDENKMSASDKKHWAGIKKDIDRERKEKERNSRGWARTLEERGGTRRGVSNGKNRISQMPQNPLLGRMAQFGMMASGMAATMFLFQMITAQLQNLIEIITKWEDSLLDS